LEIVIKAIMPGRLVLVGDGVKAALISVGSFSGDTRATAEKPFGDCELSSRSDVLYRR
jgi:hypothetical protein